MILQIVFVLLSFKNEVKTEEIKKEIESYYKTSVTVVNDQLPTTAYYKPRNRYRADEILKYLTKKYKGKRVVALTSQDISTSGYGVYDWGVFGLGSITNKVSITSTYRLKSNNLKNRVIKVLLHEIGHSYGLLHCKSKYPCFMKAGDHSIKAVDKEPMFMCSECKKVFYHQK